MRRRGPLFGAAAVSLVGIVLVAVGLTRFESSLGIAFLGLLVMLVGYVLAIAANRGR